MRQMVDLVGALARGPLPDDAFAQATAIMQQPF